MKIKMKTSMPVTVDGINTVDAAKGDELHVGVGVGADLIAAGHADSLEPAIEQKDAGDADENKDAVDAPQAKPKSRRHAASK